MTAKKIGLRVNDPTQTTIIRPALIADTQGGRSYPSLLKTPTEVAFVVKRHRGLSGTVGIGIPSEGR